MIRRSLILMMLLLGGCASTPDMAQRDPAYAAVRPVAPLPPTGENAGSIYQAGNSMSLFRDSRARRVGDILTIRLSESTNATKSASTATSRTNDVGFDNPTIFGSTVQFDAPGVLPLASNRDNTLETAFASSQAFEGAGDSQQSNALTGSVTVSVVEVLANGYLVVRGEKIISLNQGDEYVRISGIIRPQDIGSDNSVVSTKVADAQITYGGTGVLAEANTQGWLSRFFSKIWPF